MKASKKNIERTSEQTEKKTFFLLFIYDIFVKQELSVNIRWISVCTRSGIIHLLFKFGFIF